MNSHTTYASLGLGGAGAVLLPWIFQTFLHIEMPPQVAISANVLLSGLVAYFLHKSPTQGGVTK